MQLAMETGEAVDLVRQAVAAILVVGLPVLLIGLVVGLIVSVLQAVTQVQEYTLSFVPKIVAMLLGLVIFAPWMLERLIEFSRRMFTAPP